MAMELILKADMQEFTPFALNTEDRVFNSARQRAQDELGAYISDEMVTAILALTRDQDTTTELYQYWLNYVRPFVVYWVYLDLLNTHGFNFTNQGITTFRDGQNTAQGVTAQERSVLIRQHEKNRETWLNRVLREFSDEDGTFDSVVYTINTNDYATNNRKVPGLNVLGGVNKRLPFNNKFRL